MQTPIISFRDFSFQYNAQKRPTLEHINLDIMPGQKVLIVGPSGSGKSTLGNCINGLIPASYPGKISGSLTVDGIDASSAGIFEMSAHVGTVLQDPDGQFIGLTVGEDIAFSLENNCMPQDQMKETVTETARLVDVEPLLRMAPHELSGGQKQRVSLAGVMVNHTPILLFDEPLANLDPATGKQAIELIDEICQREKCTVVIIEHRLEDVLWRHVDRVILVAEGQIIADADPDMLLTKSLLAENGIREPLYCTALRYAGIQISPEMKASHLATLLLNDRDRAQLRNWFETADKANTPDDSPALLEVEGLTFGYIPEKRTLTDISFSVRKGEMISIVGRNGAGKSTLAKLICGFEKPDAGTVRLEGRDITQDTIRQRATMIGYVMQNPNQMISKSQIRDEVSLGIRNQGLSEEEITKRTEEALQICGLYPFRNWPVSALSFGQKKRVTVASVLVMGPKVIILDEPTAGQDFRHYTEIMEFLRELNRQGVTVILITHDMHLMLEYTPRAVVITNGKLLADQSAARVLCDSHLTEQAALKQTSLFTLAEKCGLDDPVRFTECFVHYDREVRS